MPDLRRFLTRAGEDYARNRGATDRLCAGRSMLHPHPQGQAWFMSAMRESLAWHCLGDADLALACLQADLPPRALKHWPDLDRIPQLQPQNHCPDGRPRELRRWARVVENCLCDLGWSLPARRNLAGKPEELQWIRQAFPTACCQYGNWHLPRVVQRRSGRLFSPCYRSQSLLSIDWPAHSGPAEMKPCPCGRGVNYLSAAFTTI